MNAGTVGQLQEACVCTQHARAAQSQRGVQIAVESSFLGHSRVAQARGRFSFPADDCLRVVVEDLERSLWVVHEVLRECHDPSEQLLRGIGVAVLELLRMTDWHHCAVNVIANHLLHLLAGFLNLQFRPHDSSGGARLAVDGAGEGGSPVLDVLCGAAEVVALYGGSGCGFVPFNRPAAKASCSSWVGAQCDVSTSGSAANASGTGVTRCCTPSACLLVGDQGPGTRDQGPGTRDQGPGAAP